MSAEFIGTTDEHKLNHFDFMGRKILREFLFKALPTIVDGENIFNRNSTGKVMGNVHARYISLKG